MRAFSVGRLSVLAFVAGSIVAISSPVSHANPSVRCRPKHKVNTLLRTRQDWVWAYTGVEEVPGNGSNVYACSFRFGRVWSLTPYNGGQGCPGPGAEPCETAGAYALSGRFVAWAQDYTSPIEQETSVAVLDLRTGKLRRNTHSGTPAPVYPGVSQTADPYVDKTVVKADGSVAWVNTDDYSRPAIHEVWKDDRTGKHRLDRSSAIDPHSLTRTGSTITWVDGGMSRSARLH